MHGCASEEHADNETYLYFNDSSDSGSSGLGDSYASSSQSHRDVYSGSDPRRHLGGQADEH